MNLDLGAKIEHYLILGWRALKKRRRAYQVDRFIARQNEPQGGMTAGGGLSGGGFLKSLAADIPGVAASTAHLPLVSTAPASVAVSIPKSSPATPIQATNVQGFITPPPIQATNVQGFVSPSPNVPVVPHGAVL